MNILVRFIGLIAIFIFIAGSTKHFAKKESSFHQKIECVEQLINTSDLTNTIDYIKKYKGISSCNPLLKKWSPGEQEASPSNLSLPAPISSHSISITRGNKNLKLFKQEATSMKS
jgi:hypothetical protein